jgi:hypothetical protein
VALLEGLSGKAAARRRRTLGERSTATAGWLISSCAALELGTTFGLVLGAKLLLPDEATWIGDELWSLDPELVERRVILGCYVLALGLVAALFVAAGFGLYLNRRTLLEGWDIEVALRRIAERHAAAAMVFIVVAVSSLALWPQVTLAEDKEPKREIAEVLKAPEFGHYRETMRWQARDPSKPKEPQARDHAFWNAIGYALAKAAEVLLWGVAIAALAYALWWLARRLPRGAELPRAAYRPPPALFGMELAPEKLPPDVPQAATELAAAGRLREALSLLYRGALSELVHRRGVQLLASHTEGEAVRLAGMPYFAALVDAWRRCAYARRMPSPEEIQSLATTYRAAFT